MFSASVAKNVVDSKTPTVSMSWAMAYPIEKTPASALPQMRVTMISSRNEDSA